LIFSGGSGVEWDPYLISTSEELIVLSLASCYWDDHFKLTANIDLEEIPITPIGDYNNFPYNTPFTGTFDGAEYSIINLRISEPPEGNVLGLFGYVDDEDAAIRDLGLIDPNVESGESCLAGALVGWLNNGSVSGCFVEGGRVGCNGIVGGLSGFNYGTISNCYATVAVDGLNYVGGLVGKNGGAIGNSYAVGGVSGTTFVGGLVGFDDNGTVVQSFWDFETTGQMTSEGGSAKSTVEMKMESTYVNWGCWGVWTINEGINYPRLVWEGAQGLLITDVPSYAGGSGDPNDPFLIATAEQLNKISQTICHMDNHFLLTADINLSGFNGQNGNTPFNMIGVKGIPFVGNFV